MGDVVALDAQGRLGQVEDLGELVEREGALGQVAGAAGLVQAQGLGGVLAHGVHEGGLVAALWDAQVDLPAPQPGQPGAHGGGVGGHLGHEDLPGDRGGGRVGDVVDTGGR